MGRRGVQVASALKDSGPCITPTPFSPRHSIPRLNHRELTGRLATTRLAMEDFIATAIVILL